ncbi:MAG: S1 RNA-binding domain-containing protein, partial [Chloroflexi bacterium]|nr:S1 RNA-binding domain-containing protein [Chloroflexota bacterium]
TGAADRYPEGMGLRVTVMRVVDFGAFAELEEGVEGLIPVSEMSWSRIASPSTVVKDGDVVDVVVIRNEAAKHRIALSMKHASPDPWAGVMDSFAKGSLVKGTVTRLESFGVFVALVPGVEAMIHISELSDQRVRACGDVVSVGQEIEAKVLDVDAAKRRIALSLKQASAASASEAPAGHGAPASKAAKKKRPARGGLSADWDWMGGGIGRS